MEAMHECQNIMPLYNPFVKTLASWIIYVYFFSFLAYLQYRVWTFQLSAAEIFSKHYLSERWIYEIAIRTPETLRVLFGVRNLARFQSFLTGIGNMSYPVCDKTLKHITSGAYLGFSTWAGSIFLTFTVVVILGEIARIQKKKVRKSGLL